MWRFVFWGVVDEVNKQPPPAPPVKSTTKNRPGEAQHYGHQGAAAGRSGEAGHAARIAERKSSDDKSISR